MPLLVRALLPALGVLLALGASPAQARVVNVGSHTSTPWTTCGTPVDCTATEQVLPVSGRLTTVRIGHDLLPTGGATTITLKLFRKESNGNLVLVRDIGEAKPVAAGTTVTQWTGLAENVTQGQLLGFFVDNTQGYELLMFSSSGGSGITLWSGQVNTSTGDHAWPPPAILSGASLNLSAVVRTPPVTTIDTGPSGFTQNGSPSFTYSADESPVSFECKLDNGAYATCSDAGYDAAGLTEGTHSFSVRAVNDIDQVGPAATRTFTVDWTAPDTSIVSGPNGVETADPRPVFTFASTEDGTFECKIDGGAFLLCPSPAQPAAELADGPHTLEVRAIDPAGNVDATPARATFTVKRPAPAAPPPWGINFGGVSWTFADPVDSLGGASTDIESIRVVYDANGRLGVLLRFYSAGPHSAWVDLHRSPDCTDYSKEIWVSTKPGNTIWSTAEINGVEFTQEQLSGDGREVLVTIEDPRVAGKALRCLSVRSLAGADTVDTLSASLVDRVIWVVPADREVIVILRRSLTPIIRVLERQTPRQLARKTVHKLYTRAPAVGSVGIEWAVSAKVARKYGVRTKRGVKKVTLAVGARKVTKKSNKVPVPVKLSKEGKKVLRKAKSLEMEVRSGYLPPGGDKLLAATKSVQLGKRR